MANEPILTVVGNLTADPDLRFTPAGAAVANFTIASTPRVKNGDQWEDGEAMFVRCAAWRQLAENVAESLTKGAQVIVQGRFKVRSYETKEGERRTSMELDVDHVGPSLQWATVSVQRAQRSGGHTDNARQARNQAADPWAAPASDSEPPF